MHELYLMTQVVKAVETKLGETGSAKLSAVRLKVSALSHMFTHDGASLQTAFSLAARGSMAEGAALEIIPVPGDAWCPACCRACMVTRSNESCSVCGGTVMASSVEPEVVIHELVIQE
ncbi:MAG TPA: hydrogenase maturation nickel metallochaperone HypA [Nitrospira sp.]|nr:hydrogenase maturation nickel metallochaperone HypA [Nitrospira sp.]